MSDKSPLFVSASELLAHSIELYTQGIERKYKFIILHLANAIELILKDRIIDLGTSIYKGNSSVTIGIWEAFTALDNANISVPERPVIELLIDDRNTIQHRFGFPNGDAVFYYLEQVLSFFRRFLKEEYDVDLVELLELYVPGEDLATVGLVEKEDWKRPLDKLFQLSPEATILQAYSLLENKLKPNMFVDNKPHGRVTLIQHSDFPRVLNDLATASYISQDWNQKFNFLRNMRNRAAHSADFQDDIPKSDWEKALLIAKDLISGVEKATGDDFFFQRRSQRENLVNPPESPETNEATETLDKDKSKSD